MKPQMYEQNLIKEVQKFPSLYRRDLIRNKTYEKSTERMNIWSTIASKVGTTAKECKHRWGKLREQYVKNVTKIIKDPNYKSCWKYNDLMTFMNDHLNIPVESLEAVSKLASNSEMFEESIIEEVKKYEVIYNSAHPDYNKPSKTEKVWAAIASAVGSTVPQCRRRWKGLKGVYMQVLSRTNDDPKYKSHWNYMNAMSFLTNYKSVTKPKPQTPLDDVLDKKLIQEVQKYECIYDSRNPDYRRREGFKNDLWCAISSVVGKTAEQCKIRWRSIRERYERECFKIASSNDYVSTWNHIDAMSFMNGHITTKPSNCSETVCRISKKDMFCRTCMYQLQLYDDTAEQTTPTYHIFQTLDFVEKLITCSNIQINPSDEYPHSVCVKCYEKVLEIHQFQTMCRDSLDEFDKMQPDGLQEYDMEASQIKQEISDESMQAVVNTSTLSHNLDNPLEYPETSKCENYLEYICDDDTIRSVFKDELDNTALSEAHDPEHNQSYQQVADRKDNKAEFIAEDFENADKKEIPPSSKVIFKCNLCPKTFLIQHCFDAHQRIHQGLSGYPCTYPNCERGYNRVTDLRRHLNVHKGVLDIFRCNINNCDLQFTRYYELNNHKRKVHKCGKEITKKKKSQLDKELSRTSFVCETCGKVCNSKRLLKNHRFTHVDESQWPFACEVEGCGKRFRLMDHFKTHKLRHDGIKNYVCPHCGNRKTTYNELKVHINSHTFERKYPCQICGKVFKSVSLVCTHRRMVHEGHRPTKTFACRFCDRKLTTARNKEIHELAHTGELAYSCKVCGKKFASCSMGLKTHMNKHYDGEKLHACKLCDKRFTFPNTLQCHMKLHFETKPYKCGECGQGFRWATSLRRHMKRHRAPKVDNEKMEESPQAKVENMDSPIQPIEQIDEEM